MRLWPIAVLFIAIVTARAGDQPGAGSHTDPAAGDSHAWAAMPSRTGSVAIQHFPPRGVDALGRRGAEDGTVRLAATLTQMPEALGASGNRLYMVFPPAAGGSSLRRQVLYIEAERGSVDGSWVGDPGGARLPSLPSLPGDEKLLGFVGSPVGPVALVAGTGNGPDRLLALVRGDWTDIGLPVELAAGGAEGRVRLVSMPEGVALVAVRGDVGAKGAWIRTLPALADGAAIDRAEWKREPLQLSNPDKGELLGAASGLFNIRGRFIAERRTAEGVEVWEAGSGGSRLLAVVKGVSRGYSAAPMEQTGRLLIAWKTQPPVEAKDGPLPIERLRIAEVSIQTGQVLFDGEAETQPPFSKVELKILAAFLVAVMLAIVVFVLRPDRPGLPLTLPKGVFLAEPGRRVMAGMLDAGFAFLIATKITGIGAGEVLSAGALTGQVEALTLYLATVGTGLFVGVLSEWVFGRSIGKSLTGMEVVRPIMRQLPEGAVEPGLARISLGGAILRNIVKWVLPPVAMSGLSSPERRHRGDTAGGTVVVVREEGGPA